MDEHYFPRLFLFALYLEWSLNTIVDKKSNAVCIFANICSNLVCGSSLCIFFSLILYFVKIYKRRGKRLNWEKNVGRQFFKYVIWIFWCFSVKTNCGCHPFHLFPFINTPPFIFHLLLFLKNPSPSAQPPFNQSHLLEKLTQAYGCRYHILFFKMQSLH